MHHKKIIAAACALALLTQSAGAGDGGMQALFDDIGAYGSVTGPSAYKAQGMNVVMGGNVFLRAPQKNHKLAQIDMPSLKMGCGGIDLYAGSFSFINKDQLVAMLKNIGSSAVSYAFKLALDSISPQINKTLTELQQVAQELNGMNINSCEAGQAIAEGTNGNWQRSAQYFAKVSAPVTGLFSDHSEARAATQGDDVKADAALAAVSDPKMKEQAKPGNVAWRAIRKLPGLDDDDRFLFMSMSGTYIVPDSVTKAPEYKSPKAISIGTFIRGSGSHEIPVYKCDDGTGPDECRVLKDGVLAVTPFGKKVESKLVAIADKFKTNSPLTATEQAFINVTGVPVYKALAVSTAVPSLGLDAVWIGNYADLIAAEYAALFISQATSEIRQAFSSAQRGSPGIAQQSIFQLLAALDTAKSEAKEELARAYSKVRSINTLAQEVLFMERAVMGGLPANLGANLRFASTTN